MILFPNKETQEQWEKECKNYEAAIWWGTTKKIDEREDKDVKYAWVIIDGKKEMIGVNNKTMKGYSMEEKIPTWKLPLEEIEYDTFERWCTSMDL